MKIFTLLVSFFLCLVLACTPTSKPNAAEAAVVDSIPTTTLQRDSFYLTSSKGDTVPTGVPIPAIGKKTLERIPAPTVINMKEEKISAFPNVVRAGDPRIVPLPEDLPVYIPGQDSIITCIPTQM